MSNLVQDAFELFKKIETIKSMERPSYNQILEWEENETMLYFIMDRMDVSERSEYRKTVKNHNKN